MRSWMVRLSKLSCVLSVSLAFGCGGKAVTESGEGDSEDGSSGSSLPRGTSGGPTASPTDGRDLDPVIELGDCEPGWRVGEAPCPWLAGDQLCYPTKEAACACICPTEGMTTCTSGLPGGEDDRVRVACE